jgi:hypothetical protein
MITMECMVAPLCNFNFETMSLELGALSLESMDSKLYNGDVDN